METVLAIVKQLEATNSNKDKLAILEANKGNNLFALTIKFLLDDFVVTGISDKKLNKKVSYQFTEMITNLEMLYQYLSTHNTGRDEDIANVKYFISILDDDYKDFVKSLVTKSLKLGITATTWNKVADDKDKIPTFSCMLAQKYWDNIAYVDGREFTLTVKEDGNRCLLIKENGNVTAFTRQGQAYYGLVDIALELEELNTDNIVIDGELMTLRQMEIPSDQRFKETMKIVRKDGEKHGVKLIAFDYLPLSDFKKGVCEIPYSERRSSLEYTFAGCEFIEPVRKLYVGTDTSMIIQYLDEMTAKGEEGVMISINNSPYECKRVKQLLKVKKMQTCDVKVLDVYEGTGKNKGRLGGITIQFKNNDEELCTCNCGSGFNDDERSLFWNSPELIIGKIVELQYFEISQDSKTKEYGLRFPVWKGIIRHDKTEISMY